jgi:hypothetical protein
MGWPTKPLRSLYVSAISEGGAPKGIFLFLPQLAFLVLQYFVDYKVGNTTERLICKIALDY